MQSSSIFLSEYTKIITASDITDQDLGVQIAFPRFQEDLILKLLDETLTILKGLSNIYHLKSDIYVVGDLHGNIRDLIRILKQVDFFNSEVRILFLGDYVDRGDFSIEVITLLFSLLVQYQGRIFLLRGNHEFSSVNMNYGFKDQLVDMYKNEKLWIKFNDVFNWLPILAIIDNNILCVHGGISPHFKSISQIENLEKPISTFQNNKILADIMWSDPSLGVSFYLESERGYGCVFGQDAVISFCRSQNIDKIIRAHQCVAPGVEITLHGKVITVFSCSNYCDNCNNLAGFLYIHDDILNQVQLLPLDILKRNKALFIDCSRKSLYDSNENSELMRNPSLTLVGSSFNTGLKASNRKLVSAKRKSSFCQSFSRNMPISLAAINMGSEHLLNNRRSSVCLFRSSHAFHLQNSDSLNEDAYNSHIFNTDSSLPPIEISNVPSLPLIRENPEECPVEYEASHLPKTLK